MSARTTLAAVVALMGMTANSGIRCVAAADATPAFAGAEGFGAVARGGAGGRIIEVTGLDDDPDNPREGSLRWAIMQPGPRIVHFATPGNIRLKAPLTVREPFLTIDGSTAPGAGVCLCDHSFNVRETHDVIVRYVRIRRGDTTVLQRNRDERRPRPRNSADLDCVSLDDAQNILFDHVSLSWSCDELFGIVRCQNVTIQWCLMAEPLSNPAIHPYGDNHAFGMNTSASTLSIHHNVIAHYVMRGPQFEANDVRRKLTHYNPQAEAINNVLFDYAHSGSRYTAGIEDHPEEAAGKTFAFQFINNVYLADPPAPEILGTVKHGVIEPLRVYVSGNIGPHRTPDSQDQWDALFAERTPMRRADAATQAQVAGAILFTPPIPVTIQPAAEAYELVLEQAGCSHRRDSFDRRIIDNVRERRFGRIVRSQNDVGGWPELK
jgi:pectate lyase